MNHTTDATAFFWDLAQEYLARPGVDEGKLMSFPCLRVEGAFFATCHHEGGELIVKLPRQRVAELIEDGIGQPFAPAGRTFKEWVLVAQRDDDRWRALMDEALTFAGGSS